MPFIVKEYDGGVKIYILPEKKWSLWNLYIAMVFLVFNALFFSFCMLTVGMFLAENMEECFQFAFGLPFILFFALLILDFAFYLIKGREMLDIALTNEEISFYREGFLYKFDQFKFVFEDLKDAIVKAEFRDFALPSTFAYGFIAGAVDIIGSDGYRINFGAMLSDEEVEDFLQYISSLSSSAGSENDGGHNYIISNEDMFSAKNKNEGTIQYFDTLFLFFYHFSYFYLRAYGNPERKVFFFLSVFTSWQLVAMMSLFGFALGTDPCCGAVGICWLCGFCFHLAFWPLVYFYYNRYLKGDAFFDLVDYFYQNYDLMKRKVFIIGILYVFVAIVLMAIALNIY